MSRSLYRYLVSSFYALQNKIQKCTCAPKSNFPHTQKKYSEQVFINYLYRWWIEVVHFTVYFATNAANTTARTASWTGALLSVYAGIHGNGGGASASDGSASAVRSFSRERTAAKTWGNEDDADAYSRLQLGLVVGADHADILLLTPKLCTSNSYFSNR